MNPLKKYSFIGTFKNHFMWMIPLAFVLVTAVSFTPIFQSHADKTEAPGQVKKEQAQPAKKPKKKPLANVTIEREGYLIKNAGTPHAFIAIKKKLVGERVPNLSNSSIEGEILEGTTIRYTITLKNKGNVNATDIDVLNELDSRFGKPVHFVTKGCGKRHKKTIQNNEIEWSNILVQRGKKCVIQYDVPATINGTMGNWLYLSPAAEGGEEIGPIEATALKVRATPENKNTESDETEEISDDTAEASGDAVETLREASQEEGVEDIAEDAIEEPIVETEILEEELTENNPEEVTEDPAEPADEVSSESAEAEGL